MADVMVVQALRIDQENLQILRDLSLLQIHRCNPSSAFRPELVEFVYVHVP